MAVASCENARPQVLNSYWEKQNESSRVDGEEERTGEKEEKKRTINRKICVHEHEYVHVNTWAICWGEDNGVLVICSVQHGKASRVELFGGGGVFFFWVAVFLHLLSKFETFIRFQLPVHLPAASAWPPTLCECLNFMCLCSIFKFYLFHLSRWIFCPHNTASAPAASSNTIHI